MKPQQGKQYGRFIGVGLAITLVLVFQSFSAQAADKYWGVPATGNWNVAGNWSPAGVPINSDNVFLTKNDVTTYVVDYDKPNPPAALNNFSVQNSGTGSMEMKQGYSSTQDFMAVTESLGGAGKGKFSQKSGVNSTNQLNINSLGTYLLEGGTLQANQLFLNNAGTFEQKGGEVKADFQHNGGTVLGNFTNNWNYTYNLGTFTGRLINRGNLTFNNHFTAENGMANYSEFKLSYTDWRELTFNGLGLENNAAMTLNDVDIRGSGPAVNHGYLNLRGSIRGGGSFTNNGIFVVNGKVDITKTGNNINNSVINFWKNTNDLPQNPVLALTDETLASYTLSNYGTINLGDGGIIWKGKVNNNSTGMINGGGLINSAFTNFGVMNVFNPLHIVNSFTNADTGYISITNNLSGGGISNYGAIEGGSGLITNTIVNRGLLGVGGEQNLRLAGKVTNTTDGEILVRNGSRIVFTQGLAVNDGVIIVKNSTFINNGFPITNNGKITLSGNWETGGITNAGTGKIYFTPLDISLGQTTVTGNITNNTGGLIVVQYEPVYFTGNIVNNGTFKVTSTQYFCLGTFTGSITSDPAENHLTDLVTRPQDHLIGGRVGSEVDKFFISNDFINQSKQNLAWNTLEAELKFVFGDDNKHAFHLAGADIGNTRKGFQNNFAWGVLDISGQRLDLLDGNTANAGTAFYAGEVLGAAITGNIVTNIFGHGGNIYYDPLLIGNDYLQKLEYALQDGGFLIPVTGAIIPTPLPGSLWLILSGLACMAGIGRRQAAGRKR